jgi:hypothetical protein
VSARASAVYLLLLVRDVMVPVLPPPCSVNRMKRTSCYAHVVAGMARVVKSSKAT